MITSLTQKEYLEQARLFKVLIHPARLKILDILRDGEQCVCHLEAFLGYRQAYISQHLTILRAAGMVGIRRDGWNIYYQIIDKRIVYLLDASRSIEGYQSSTKTERTMNCPCPKCKVKNKENEITVEGVTNVKH